MSPLSLSGRVVNAVTLAPLANANLRLIGPANLLTGVPGVEAAPPGRQITWTHTITGFAGSRWDCWVAHVKDKVQGITWEQFRDGALTHNLALPPTNLFRTDQDYLIPESRPAEPFTWSRVLRGFAGSRWDCWVAHVKDKVQGITWEQFRDGALLYNPQLNTDGRLFKTDKSYFVPQNDSTPRAQIQVTTDAQGNYLFTLAEQAALVELQVELDDYARFVMPLVINGALIQPIILMPETTTTGSSVGLSGTVRSARTDYTALPEKARRVIDMALFMLGDDRQVYNALPPELQRMCYGSLFLSDPNNYHYKDIVCADLVSVALKGAGFDIAWGNGNTRMADYYHPDRGTAKLVEVFDPKDWLPGDVIVFGRGAPTTRAGHVALYVGQFAGMDRTSKIYNLSDTVDVVEASIDFESNGKKVGTGVQGRTLQLYCLQKKAYTYEWTRHVRLRELGALFGR